MTRLCTILYRNFDSQHWNEDDLATLPGNELRFLCKLLGIAYSDTKAGLVVRLLSTRIVRRELAHFGDDPQAVASAFKRDRLRWMCMQNHLWRSGNKRALAICLLNWRNRCRLEGQKYLNGCLAHTRQAGEQLELF